MFSEKQARIMVLDPPLAQPLVGRLCVIGIGLIGSSILRAAAARGLRERWLPMTAQRRCARASELGLADSVATTPAEAVADADIIILYVPVGAMAAVAEAIAPYVKPGAIVSDVGSVKGAVLSALRAHLPTSVHVIPGHPVAGTEYSGPDAGFATLFQDAAGRSSLRRKTRMRARSRVSRRCGRRWAPMSRS